MTTAHDSEDREITIGAKCTVAYDKDIATVTGISEDGEMVRVEHADRIESIEAYHVHLVR